MEDVKESCDDTKKDVPNSSGSGSKDLGKSIPGEAFNYFLQGKRHMLVQDYSSAVQSLATACEMFVNHCGELAIECAEVYFLYGKALFRLSQQQAGILGGALNDGSNEESSSESESKENESDKNSDGEEGEENEAEANEQEEKEEKEPSESTDSPPAVVDDDTSEVKADVSSEAKTETSVSNEASGSSQKVEPDSSSAGDHAQVSEDSKMEESIDETKEDEDDLELAWNTLETAKSIFKRLNTVDAQLKVAEILQLLAEISMESDNNAAAISDLKESLEIQKKHLNPDDRILAETYYQMGLALMLDKIYPQALENFRKTQQILELRIENLKNKPVDEADGTFASADKEAEISELENVLLDIKEKIDDTEELICNKKKELEESLTEEAASMSPVKDVKDASNKPVSNITHLLKRKKPDEGTSEDTAKRIKVSNVPNGDSKVTEPESTNAEG